MTYKTVFSPYTSLRNKISVELFLLMGSHKRQAKGTSVSERDKRNKED